MRVGELLGQAVQTIGFFECRQVFALQIFDQRKLQGFGVVGDFLDAGQFFQPRFSRGVIPAFTGNDVVTVFARHVADEQRLKHASRAA